MFFGSDDDADAKEEEQREEPEETEPEPDLGASVVELEDGRVEVELGEDETGQLVALVLEQEHYYTGDDTQLTLMLLPEGTELPSSGRDLPEYPDTDVHGEPFEQNEPGFWYPDDLAAYFGGTVLG